MEDHVADQKIYNWIKEGKAILKKTKKRNYEDVSLVKDVILMSRVNFMKGGKNI